MFALHGKLASQEVIRAEGFDPAGHMQEKRRTCLELGQLRDTAVAGRKIHASFGPISDAHDETLKSEIVRDNAEIFPP